MINKLLVIALIIISATLFMPVEMWQNSAVVIETMGYRVSSNWLVIMGCFLILILTSRLLVAVPRGISLYYHKICSKDQAYILQNLLLAIHNHQAKLANKFLAKIKKEQSSTVKILQVKVMQLQQAKSEKIIEELIGLLSDNDSKIFALEELIKIYAGQGNWIMVNDHTAQLWDIYPSRWLLNIKMSAVAQLGIWEEALPALESGLKNYLLSKDAFKQLQAITRYKMAYALQEVDVEKAIKLLDQAMEMDAIQPYLLMIKLQIKANRIDKGIVYAKKAWKYSPDKAVAKQVMLLTQRLSPKEFHSTCRDITSGDKDHYESLILMAESYILLDDLIQANSLLHKALALQHDQRVYLLLSRCCHLMHGSITEIYDWLSKACNMEVLPEGGHLYWDITQMRYTAMPGEKNMIISLL